MKINVLLRSGRGKTNKQAKENQRKIPNKQAKENSKQTGKGKLKMTKKLIRTKKKKYIYML